MLRGLQAGFGDPLGAPLLAALMARGITLVRADLQGVQDRTAALALVHELRHAGVRPLVIIRVDQAAWLEGLPSLDVELLNEPDLAGWTASHYAEAVREVAQALDPGHRLWAGSVSNCTADRLRWLASSLAGWPLTVGVTVHRYPKNGAKPSQPQEGFRTRQAEMTAVQRLVGSRPWGCSEVGYHTGPQKTGWWFWTRRWHWTDDQVAQFAREEWARWTAAGAGFAVWYQLNDGLGGDPLDRFGIRRTDGTWKPVADTCRP